MNITEPLRRQAEATPDAVAMIRPDHTPLTYRALDRMVDRCAHRALSQGIGPGQTIGLAIGGPDESLAIIMALALARIGAASADLLVPAERLSTILVQRGAPSPAVAAPILVYGPDWTDGAGREAGLAIPLHAGGATPFRIVSTSGTSGVPRFGIMTHAMIAARVSANSFPRTGQNSRPVTICAIGGVPGLRGALTTLRAGGMVVCTQPRGVADAILRYKVTLLLLSPFVLQQVLAALPDGIGQLPSLEAVVTLGSALPIPLAARAARMLCRNVLTHYGSTEGGAVAVGPFGPTSGRLIPEVDVQAVDESHQPLPPGQEGLLRVRTPGMLDGYLDNPQATAAAFRDGWFYPGDIGLVTEDRVLIVRGRANEVINTGGAKIHPRAVENVLLAFPGAIEAAAFGVPDGDGLIQIWAAVVGEAPLDIRSYMLFCRERLGASAPGHMVQVEALPRNPNGKVMIEALINFALRRTRPPAPAAG